MLTSNKEKKQQQGEKHNRKEEKENKEEKDNSQGISKKGIFVSSLVILSSFLFLFF